MIGEWLLCDFHIHTKLSDGHLALSQVVDIYGGKRFDVICITDHILDPVTIEILESNGEELFGMTQDRCEEYLRLLSRERRRAWEEYRMLLVPGFEVTNDHEGYHILGIDVRAYVNPGLPVEGIIEAIHNQGGIAVACHPHHKESEPKYDSFYLWDRHEKYAPLFDAWEVANRDDLFNTIGLKKFNYIANSDFHERRHLYSWKTLIHADKNEESVKQAIRENGKIAIHLFRKEKPISR
jgi:predicted metal-dependent phosphoesterase TrpH